MPPRLWGKRTRIPCGVDNCEDDDLLTLNLIEYPVALKDKLPDFISIYIQDNLAHLRKPL